MVGVSTLLFIGFSQSTPAQSDAEIGQLIYRPGLLDPDEGATGLADWRVQAVILMIIMGGLLAYFW